MLSGEIAEWRSDGRGDRELLRAIEGALEALPLDTDSTPRAAESTAKTAERILASMPWARGKEPFVAAVKARAALEALLAN
jgi:hypothetical protein